MAIQILQDVSLGGSLNFLDAKAEFPANPSIGTMILKGNAIYAYIVVGGLETWYPFANRTNSYVHTQGLASTVWTVTHNLHSTDIWMQVKDSSGKIVTTASTIVDENTVLITFTTGITGTVVIVAADSIDVPEVKASLITVGANVEINSTGVLINGEYALTSANIDQQIADAVSAEATIRAAADTTLTNNLTAETSARIAADALKANITYVDSTFSPIGHGHSIADVTNLQTALNSKLAAADYTAADVLAKLLTVDGAGSGLDADTLDGLSSTAFAKSGGDLLTDFNANDITVSGNILPTTNGIQDIGSETNRFGTIYVNEARLSTNTLYIGDTAILGTTADTINIKADPNQSINMQTSGTGSTLVTSAKQVSVETTGMNADVVVQASGTGSKVRLGGTLGVDVVSPLTVTGDTVVTGTTTLNGALTVTGNVNFTGTTTTVNSTTVTTKDNIIVVNSGEVGTGVTAGKAGIQVDRGEEADYQIIFDETDDLFKVGMVNQLETIATRPWIATNTAPIVHTHTDATTSVSGFLSATDKTKLDSLANYTHPTSGVTAGTYPKVTVNANGHVTAGTTLSASDIPDISATYQPKNANLTTVSGLSTASTGLVKLTNGVASLDSNAYITGNQSISVTGDATGSGTTAISLTLSNSGATAGTYPKVTVNTKGLVTAGAALVAADIPALDAAKITTGTVSILRMPAFTGDISTTAGSTSTTLATVADSGLGEFKKITVDTKGRVTGTVAVALSDLTGLGASTLALGATAGAALAASGSAGSASTAAKSDHVHPFPTAANVGAISATGNILPLTQGDISSATLTTSTTTANQVVDSNSATLYRTAKYLVQITSGTAYHSTEIMIIHDGTTAYLSEFGIVTTGAVLATFDADISAGNLRLLVTPVNAATTIKVIKTLIDI
jgi:hypothetical protein